MTPSCRSSIQRVRPVERGESGRGRVVIIVRRGGKELGGLRRLRIVCRNVRRCDGEEAVGG